MRHIELKAANDDVPPASDTVDLVAAHLAARGLDRRLMISVAAAAAAVLSMTLLNGYQALQTLPDNVTFASRV